MCLFWGARNVKRASPFRVEWFLWCDKMAESLIAVVGGSVRVTVAPQTGVLFLNAPDSELISVTHGRKESDIVYLYCD